MGPKELIIIIIIPKADLHSHTLTHSLHVVVDGHIG